MEKIYKVSEQTAMYIDAMKKADMFYRSVQNACLNHFGEGQEDNVMQEFNERYTQMMAEVKKLFLVSVDENLAKDKHQDFKI